ncbi:MAG: glycosyltransferase family 39 protein [Zoogloeaceae bacterium]|jgi:hypothetical protein|nr:glycosyltransferase family 39 protein [Zoogloeaceae bacterium]
MPTFFIHEFHKPGFSRIGDAALVTSIILAGTIFPRLMLLGLFPLTDDGYYAYVAQQIHHSLANGQGIPDAGGISLYPMLCSWVFSLQNNPFISLRLIDLGVAVIMSFLLYKVLARTCNNNTGAALITLVFTFTLNQLVFIDGGFKNSITVAFVPLLLALYIGMRAIQNKESSGSAWWMAGALTALAVVFRETFVPFVLLGLVSVFIAQGRKAALQFLVGGMAAGIVLIGGILVARGGVTKIIASYRAARAVFGSASGDLRLEHFYSYGMNAANFSSIALAFGILAVVILSVAIFLRREKSLLLAAIFWLSFIVAALIEAATKISYTYHFAIAFPGLSGLCALALREIIRIWPAMRWMNGRMNNILAVAGIVLSAAWLYFSCSRQAIFYWPMTLEALIVAPGGGWPEKFTDRSYYLRVAAEIKKIIPENGTLSISRNAHALYPLTGNFPPDHRLNDLNTTAILLNFSVPAIRQVLLDCAPDVLMITTLNDWPTGGGNAYLLEAVLATGIYEAAVKIPYDRRNRDRFEGSMIFRKTKETACRMK